MIKSLFILNILLALNAGAAFGQVPADAYWDARFDSLGLNGPVYAIAVDSANNCVYVGGKFSLAGSLPVNNIARWNGTGWTALGAGVDSTVRAIGVQGSSVYVGGDFLNAGGASASRIAKWNGSSWSALNGGTNGQVRAITTTDSLIYIGGSFTATDGDTSMDYLAKWNGSAWSRVATGFPRILWTESSGTRVNSIALLGNKIFIGGNFAVEVSDWAHIAQGTLVWNGTTWLGLGISASNPKPEPTYYTYEVYAVKADAQGQVHFMRGWDAPNTKWTGSAWVWEDVHSFYYATRAGVINGSERFYAGDLEGLNEVRLNAIGRFRNGVWEQMGSGIDNVIPKEDEGAHDYVVYSLDLMGNKLYVGGNFKVAGKKFSRNFAIYTISAPPTLQKPLRDTTLVENFSKSFVAKLTDFFADADGLYWQFQATSLSAGVTPLVSNDSLYLLSVPFFNGTSKVRVTASDGQGSVADTFSVSVLNTVSQPTGLAITQVNQSFQLSWNAVQDPEVIRYRIFKGSAPSPVNQVDSVPKSMLSATLSMTPYGQTKYYRVVAVDSFLTVSPPSNDVILRRRFLNVPSEYATLQAAIDALSPHDTIFVSGSLTESVSITKPLTIMGVDSASVNGVSPSSPTITVTADSVYLVNLRVTGASATGSNWISGKAAIRLSNGSNSMIRGVTAIGGNAWEATATCQAGNAVEIQSGSSILVDRSYFMGGTAAADRVSGSGLKVTGSTNVSVTRSTIVGGTGSEYFGPAGEGQGGIGLNIRTSSAITLDSLVIRGGKGPKTGGSGSIGRIGGAGLSLDSCTSVNGGRLDILGGEGGNGNIILGSGATAVTCSSSSALTFANSLFKGGRPGTAYEHVWETRGGNAFTGFRTQLVSITACSLTAGSGRDNVWEVGSHGGTGLSLTESGQFTIDNCTITGGNGTNYGYTISGAGGHAVLFDSSSSNTIRNSSLIGGNAGLYTAETYSLAGGDGIRAIRHSSDSLLTYDVSAGAGNPGGSIVFTDGTSHIYTNPPAKPDNLVASTTPSTIMLNWTPGAEYNLVRYYICLDTLPNASTVVDSVDVPQSSSTLTGLTNGTTYYVRIRAVNSNGQPSGYSDEATATPQALLNAQFTPVDASTGLQPVTLTFDRINIEGNTVLVISDSGAVLPGNVRKAGPFYHLSTAASYEDSITVTIAYGDTSVIREDSLRLLHYANGEWTEITRSINAVDNTISGRTSSLSPFVLAEPSNYAPAVPYPFSDTVLAEGFSRTFMSTASSRFHDPDGDPLNIDAVSLDYGVVTEFAGDSIFVSGQPSFYGIVRVKVSASDGQYTVADTFLVEVTNVVPAPGLLGAVPGNHKITLHWSSSGADISRYLIYGGPDNPPASVIDSTTDTARVVLDLQNETTYHFAVRAVDTMGMRSDLSNILSMQAFNSAPLVTIALRDTSLMEDFGSAFLAYLPLHFADPDESALVFQSESFSPHISVTTSGDSLYISADPDFFGSGLVIVSASDGEKSTVDTLTIEITSVNDPPVLVTPIADVTFDEDAGIIMLAALGNRFTDAENDHLQFQWETSDTALVSLYMLSDTLFASTKPDRNGNATVTVMAIDPWGASATNTFTIRITPVNDPPFRRKAIADTSVVQNFVPVFISSLYNYFGDIDNEVLTFEAQKLENGVSLSVSADTLKITSVAGFYGTVRIRVTADDGLAGVADTFTVTVHDVTPPVLAVHALAPPVVRVVRFGIVANETVTGVSFSVNGVSIPVAYSAGLYFADLMDPANGQLNTTATAIDASGNSAISNRAFTYHPLDKPLLFGSLQINATAGQDGKYLLISEAPDMPCPRGWAFLRPPVDMTPSAGNVALQLQWSVESGSYDPSKIGIYELEEETGVWSLLGSRRNGLVITAAKNGSGKIAVMYNPDQQTLPGTFSLKQNYPNPFNPTTTIPYDLPGESRVSIVIYNILGARVTELVNQKQPAGSYAVQWNGRNDRGELVASGIYFCRITAESFVKTRKMMFLK